MDIICKAAMNKGTSSYVLVAYRHVVATIMMAPFAIILERRRTRPKMTISAFIKLLILSLLGPVVNQNLYFLGMEYTTATLAAAMSNIMPAVASLMAWILRGENVRFRNTRSQAKVVGNLATVLGAMIMTLVKGPVIESTWSVLC